MLKQLLHDDRGATAIEYGLIVALISLLLVGAFISMGLSLTDIFTTATTAMAAV